MKSRRAMHHLDEDAGMTLVEVLVAVSILAIAVVTIVAGLGSTAFSSDVHRKQATGNAVARSYAEALAQAVRGDTATHYAPCGTSASYAPTVNAWLPATAGFSPTISAIAYLWPDNTFHPTCPVGGDLGLQRITVQVKSTDMRENEQFDVIVRQP